MYSPHGLHAPPVSKLLGGKAPEGGGGQADDWHLAGMIQHLEGALNCEPQ